MKKIILILALLLSSTVYAIDNGQGRGQRGQRGQRGGSDLDELKRGCTNPASVGNQIRPSRIQIFCKDVRFLWVPGDRGSRTVDQRRNVFTSLITNKTNLGIAEEDHSVAIDDATLNCPTLREIRQEATFNYMVTCDEVLEIDSLLEFCESRIDEDIDADMIESVPTRRSINACNLNSNGRRWGGQKRN